MNPYWGTNFFTFFSTLFCRLSQALQGNLRFDQLASDEVQMLVLVALSLSCSLIGSFLVYKRMTMVANSLSHTILLGIVIAYLLFQATSFLTAGLLLDWKIAFCAALIAALLTALLTQFLIHVLRVQEDASIGLVFTTLFALAILLVTLYTRDLHLGTEVIMGNVDALHGDDIKLVSLVAGGNLLIVGLLFRPLMLSTFDATLAKSFGVPTQLLSYLLMFLTAMTAVAAFRAVGVLLFLALLVGPVLTAALLTHRLKRIIGLSMLLSSACSICAVALSRHLLTVHQTPLSTAGLLVTLIGLVFVCFLVFRKKKSTRKKSVPQKIN